MTVFASKRQLNNNQCSNLIIKKSRCDIIKELRENQTRSLQAKRDDHERRGIGNCHKSSDCG